MNRIFQRYLDPYGGQLDSDCFVSNASLVGAVILFNMADFNSCNSYTRCNIAADAGAVGCLLYDTKDRYGVISCFLLFLLQIIRLFRLERYS